MSDRSSNRHETDKRFPSGLWMGYWIQGYIKGRMRLTLEFIEGGITGSGTDAVGPFDIKGVYSKKHNMVCMDKRYRGAHSVGYCGCANDGGLDGTWYLAQIPQIDIWRLWPVDEAFDVVPVMAAAEDEPVVLIGGCEIENIEEEFNAEK